MNQSPAIILIIGKPGSGKSTLAKKISQHTGFQVIDTIGLRTEAIKKGETNNGFTIQPNFQGNPAQLLTMKIREKIKNLGGNTGLIIEGVWKAQARREEIIASAKAENKPVILIEVGADYETRRKRIESRKVTGIGIEDTNQRKILDEYEKTYEPINDIDGISYIELDTSNGKYTKVKTTIHTNHQLIKGILKFL